MKLLLLLIHFLSQLFIGGSFVIALGSYFKSSDWGRCFVSIHELFNKLLWAWGLGLIILMIFEPQYFPWGELTPNKKIYLNQGFLVARNIAYFLISWFCLRTLPRLSPLSLFCFITIGVFFSVDWGMSLEGEWVSNMYGLIYLANGVQGAMALVIWNRFINSSTKGRIDMVHLLLAVSILWFYLRFSQYIIIWMGNIPREATFYIDRFRDFTGYPLAMTFFFKLFPIAFISFFPQLKLNPRMVRPICVLIFFTCIFEVFWIVRFP